MGTWVKYAYASKKDLLQWYDDLLLRVGQLTEYSDDLEVPKSLWISGLFNPMSFLTAIMQVTARRDGLPLDDMNLRTDITNIRDPAERPSSNRSSDACNFCADQGCDKDCHLPMPSV